MATLNKKETAELVKLRNICADQTHLDTLTEDERTELTGRLKELEDKSAGIEPTEQSAEAPADYNPYAAIEAHNEALKINHK